MKRFLSTALVFAFILTLCACAADAGSDATTAAVPLPALRVGFGRASIIPSSPLPLSSTKQDAYSGVYDEVYVTCIAISDAQDQTVLMYTIDVSYTNQAIRNNLFKAATQATGISKEYISISCTHNHSGLSPSGAAENILKKAVAESGSQAMADRSEASLEIGTAYPEGFNFVRHYTTSDNYWVGDNYYSPTGTKAAAHEREADNEMQLMQFVREGKQNILLCNWQAHAVYSYHMEYLCADYIGPLRETVESQTGVLFAFFQGAAGNLNPWSNIGGKNIADRSLAGMTVYGTKLAEYPIAALKNLTAVDATGISILESVYTANVHRDSFEVIEAANTFLQVRNNGGSLSEAVAASNELIHSDDAVSYVTSRVKKGTTGDITLRVLRLGDVAFAIVPYEMFDDSGLYIKEHSPFEMTFIMGYTNGREGYIPSAPCIEHGCYGFECGLYAAGTAEALVDEYVKLLTQLKN